MQIFSRFCTFSVVFLASLAVPLEFARETISTFFPSSKLAITKSTNQGSDTAGEVHQTAISFSSESQPTNGLDSFKTINLSTEPTAASNQEDFEGDRPNGCFFS
ncbi:hypothetical protein C8R43DRAFT_556278 [Mycena crocata]|nr:hypothetical protein C8R43DRAFT_556278 [Mycena crocata]